MQADTSSTTPFRSVRLQYDTMTILAIMLITLLFCHSLAKSTLGGGASQERRLELKRPPPLQLRDAFFVGDFPADRLRRPIVFKNLSISSRRCHTSTEDFRTETSNHLDTISTATYQKANYSLIDTADDVYQPTISFTDDARYKEIMRRRMRRRQMRKAQLIFRDNLMTDQEDRTSYNDPGFLGRLPGQSTTYCDIDANDDATLWMLRSLSGKLLRTKNTFGQERDLGERILIRQIAEKAFNHLFPPIKV